MSGPCCPVCCNPVEEYGMLCEVCGDEFEEDDLEYDEGMIEDRDGEN